MPIHDWTKVDAGIFHHFRLGWIEEIARELNRGVLPDDDYAMAEQHTSDSGPDVLTLQSRSIRDHDHDERATAGNGSRSSDGGVVVAKPKARLAGETDLEFHRRKVPRRGRSVIEG